MGRREKKKRYGWLVAFAIINWLLIGMVTWRVDPDSMKDVIFPGSYMPMVLLVMGGVFWLFSILLLSARRALVWSLAVAVFLELRFLGLGSAINGLLMVGLLLSWELYHFRSETGQQKMKDDKVRTEQDLMTEKDEV